MKVPPADTIDSVAMTLIWTVNFNDAWRSTPFYKGQIGCGNLTTDLDGFTDWGETGNREFSFSFNEH